LLLLNRYLHHPFYRYRAWLATGGSASAVFITRNCTHDGAVALRIVDFLGAPRVLAKAGAAFQRLLAEYAAEYLDFYCCGLSEELAAAGLRDLQGDAGLILPAYFEPFVARNVDLHYALKGPGGRLIICKGDADQDRPNMLQDDGAPAGAEAADPPS